MRRVYDLNDNWFFAKTTQLPQSLSEVQSGAGTAWESVTLPHTWNAEDGQDGGNDYYRGTGMYVRGLSRSDLLSSVEKNSYEREDGERLVLEFPAAAMTADVYLDGKRLLHHEGARLLEGIMAKASASRGEVAESTRGNANLQKMMAGMTMEKLLKQAGEAISPEEVQEFQAGLQRIKKG